MKQLLHWWELQPGLGMIHSAKGTHPHRYPDTNDAVQFCLGAAPGPRVLWSKPELLVSQARMYSLLFCLLTHPSCPRCPHDETVTYLNAIGESTTAKFSFQMFQFVGYSEVFLHCRVRLCLPDSPEPCAKVSFLGHAGRALPWAHCLWKGFCSGFRYLSTINNVQWQGLTSGP